MHGPQLYVYIMAARLRAVVFHLPRVSSERFIPSQAPRVLQSTRWRSSLSSSVGDTDQFLYAVPGLNARIIDGKKMSSAVRSEIADQVRRRYRSNCNVALFCGRAKLGVSHYGYLEFNYM